MTFPDRCVAYRPTRPGPCAESTLEVVLTLVSAGVRVTARIVLARGKRCQNRA